MGTMPDTSVRGKSVDFVETTVSTMLSSVGFTQEATVKAGLYESRKMLSEATCHLFAQIMGSSPLPVWTLLKLI